MNTIELFKILQSESLQLVIKKNNDYGNAFSEFGTIGILIRIFDKLKRYISITNNNVQLVNDESLRDTLIDLQNYASLAIITLDNPK